MSTPENVRLREEAAARCTAKIKRKVLKKTSQKIQGGVRGEKLLATGEEEEQKKTVDGTVCDRAFHRRQRRTAGGTVEAL